jgi:hypothetical protein
MKRVATVLSAAAVVLWAAGVFAQAKPDFSGSWTVDAEKTAAANPNMAGGGGGRGGGGGGAMTMKHVGSSLTIETQGRQGAVSTTYAIDGAAIEVPAGRGGGTAMAKAMWEGNTIAIVTTLETGQRKVVYSMEGDWLVVSTTQPGRDGGAPTTMKRYYKKGM